MIRKLIKKHNNQIKSILSILLCLALIGGTITSVSVFAEEPATESGSEIATETGVLAESQTDVVPAGTEETSEETETETAEEPETEEQTAEPESLPAETKSEKNSETESETELPETTLPETELSETELPETDITETELAETESEYPAATFEETLDEGITVSASAEAGILPEGASMRVTLLEADKDETAAMYSEAEAALEENEISYDGLIALDISFLAADGAEIEPEEGSVTVKIDVASALLEEDVDTDSLEVQHLAETKDGLVVEIVADTGEEAKGTIETDEDGGVSTEFTVDSFSYFTLTYNNRNNLTIYLVDEDGNDILGSGSLGSVTGSTSWTAIETAAATYISQAESNGYTYEGAHLGSYNSSTSVTYVKYNQASGGGGGGNQSGWRYSSATTTPNNYTSGTSVGNNVIYLVFKTTGTGTETETETETESESESETEDNGKTITFVYYSQTELDQTNPDTIKAAKDTVKFTVNLLDEDGNLTETEIPSGAVIPTSYTSNSSVVLISELLNQISVPGYTLEDGYAFFFWSGNTSVSQGLDLSSAGAHKVVSFKNFDDVSSYGDGSANLGTTTTSNTYHTIGYTMTELNGSSMTGTDWSSSGDTEGYYAYEYGGVLHIVLKPVSSTVAYQTRWVNYAETDSTLVDTTDAHDMTKDDSGNWYGYLTQTTTYWDGTGLTSPGEDYVFVGWYDSCDADGNGTGNKIEGNEVMYSDNTVYARWELSVTTMSVTVVKKVDGNMGDKTQEFSFTVTDSSGDTTSFDLKDGEEQSVDDLTIGSEITISESGNDNYDSITIQYGSYDASNNFVAYETYEPGVSSSSATITLESEYDVILVTNYKNVDPDTGIHLDFAPYFAILSGILLLGLLLLIRSTRGRYG